MHPTERSRRTLGPPQKARDGAVINSAAYVQLIRE
jgi:hypothetical protein